MTYIPFTKFKNWCQNVSSKFNKHTTQLGGLYFAKNSSGQWGYKTSVDGAVTPFQNKTVHTGTYDLGNNNNGSAVDMGVDHSYRYIKASGLYTKAQYDANYNAGVSAADGRANTNSTNYKTGYNKGVSDADGRANANSTNYKSGRTQGQTDVKNSPNSYGLYTKSQYDANYNAGVSAGKVNPTLNKFAGKDCGDWYEITGWQVNITNKNKPYYLFTSGSTRTPKSVTATNGTVTEICREAGSHSHAEVIYKIVFSSTGTKTINIYTDGLNSYYTVTAMLIYFS